MRAFRWRACIKLPLPGVRAFRRTACVKLLLRGLRPFRRGARFQLPMPGVRPVRLAALRSPIPRRHGGLASAGWLGRVGGFFQSPESPAASDMRSSSGHTVVTLGTRNLRFLGHPIKSSVSHFRNSSIDRLGPGMLCGAPNTNRTSDPALTCVR